MEKRKEEKGVELGEKKEYYYRECNCMGKDGIDFGADFFFLRLIFW